MGLETGDVKQDGEGGLEIGDETESRRGGGGDQRDRKGGGGLKWLVERLGWGDGACSTCRVRQRPGHLGLAAATDHLATTC